MVLPGEGSYLSLSNIQAEFGGTNPIFLSEYYTTGEYTTGVPNLPASGPIFLSQFSGKSNPANPPSNTNTNLVVNANFTSTTGWTNSAGWGAEDNNSQLYTNNRPSIKTNDTSSTFPSYLMFSYVQGQTVTQTISLTNQKESYTFSFYVRTFMNRNMIDKYYAYASFKNASGVQLQRIGILTYTDIQWSDPWQLQTFSTNVSMMSATSVTITLSGYDVGFWAGNYGPQFTEVQVV